MTSDVADTFVLPAHLDYDDQLKPRTSSRVRPFSGLRFWDISELHIYARLQSSTHYYNLVQSNSTIPQKNMTCVLLCLCWENTIEHIGAWNKYARHEGHGIHWKQRRSSSRSSHPQDARHPENYNCRLSTSAKHISMPSQNALSTSDYQRILGLVLMLSRDN